MLINGVQGNFISIHDRGLMYGDGVFRTMLVRNGQIRSWPRHYNKLRHDCSVLNLDCPSEAVLVDELGQLTQLHADEVAKIIITRGTSSRGYAPPQPSIVTRILSVAPAPDYPDAHATQGIAAHICRLHLAHQPRLAGIKHLNRLENVLAASELNGLNVHEGMLFDMAGHLIEATRSNVFLVRDGELFTPDLSNCGVAGVQRDRVIEWASQHGVRCHISNCSLEDMLTSDEVFLVNSVIGLWPIREMPGFRCEHHPISLRIQHWLKHENY